MPSAFFATAVAVVPLGIARGAIDGLTALAARKRLPGGRAGLNDQAFAQYAAAKAEALVASASLYLRQSITTIWNTVRGGGTADLAARARCRGAVVQAGEASAEAVDLCCRAAGGNALAESEPFEKALRDVRAAIGHISMQRGAMEDVGRVAFGMAPNSPMF
jgi:alkylation response protein AidB-like acyl-CoA dehydrogenase